MGMSSRGTDVPCPCHPSLRLGDAAGDRSSPSSEKKRKMGKKHILPLPPLQVASKLLLPCKILSLFQQSQHKVSTGPPRGFPAVQEPLAAIYVPSQDCPTRLLGRRDLFALEILFF